MKKFFLSLAVFAMALCANAQTNQYFWYQGNLMMGNPIAQIDSVTFGEGEPADTLHILLPRTIIKTVHDTVYVTIHDTVCPNDLPDGALPGEFSVSATKKVRFSKGNLQYQASTDTWRFAEHQLDTVGVINANISDNYTGWIDCFGWGTGNNPTKTNTNYYDYTTFVDWGENKISNGGDIINMWRTLTNDEWNYLFYERDNAAGLFGLGNVEGMNGLILLPDLWNIPDGVLFSASTTKGLVDQGDYFTNSKGDNFTHNFFTLSQWSLMESAGAIFLPAAGARLGQKVYDVNSRGYYWSASPSDSGGAYNLRFYSEELTTKDSSGRSSGITIRLVQDVE